MSPSVLVAWDSPGLGSLSSWCLGLPGMVPLSSLFSPLQRWQDLNVISSLLKSFFRKLPEPLFTDGESLRPSCALPLGPSEPPKWPQMTLCRWPRVNGWYQADQQPQSPSHPSLC